MISANTAATAISALAEQRLVFSLSPTWHRDPPACAVVLPVDDSNAHSPIFRETKHAIAVHLGGCLERVIGPATRDRLLKKYRLDLRHPGDARNFAWKPRCRAVLMWQLTTASETSMLAYGARQIGLKLTLKGLGRSDIL